ncbi:MAG: S1C family serine protease [Thermoguttaceae bacterium]
MLSVVSCGISVVLLCRFPEAANPASIGADAARQNVILNDVRLEGKHSVDVRYIQNVGTSELSGTVLADVADSRSPYESQAYPTVKREANSPANDESLKPLSVSNMGNEISAERLDNLANSATNTQERALVPNTGKTVESNLRPRMNSIEEKVSVLDDVVAAFQPSHPRFPVCFGGIVNSSRILPTSFSEKASSNAAGSVDLTSDVAEATFDIPTLTGLEEDLKRSHVVNEVKPSIVKLDVKSAPTKVQNKDGKWVVRENIETGDGFFLQFDNRLWVLTNGHVVNGYESTDKITVTTFYGQTFSPLRVLSCTMFDIAVLEVDPKDVDVLEGVKLARLGSSDYLDDGFYGFTIGHPLNFPWSYVDCHIGSTYRDMGMVRESSLGSDKQLTEGERKIMRFIQVDANINQGNSGGPLCNRRGEVVGVITSSVLEDARPRGIGFVIPIEDALRAVRKLVDSNGAWRPSYLGVSFENDGGLWSAKSNGAKVNKVIPNSPAAYAGLKDGDRIVKFDGRPVKNDYDLARMIALSRPDQKGEMEIQRGAQSLVITFNTRAISSSPSKAYYSNVGLSER